MKSPLVVSIGILIVAATLWATLTPSTPGVASPLAAATQPPSPLATSIFWPDPSPSGTDVPTHTQTPLPPPTPDPNEKSQWASQNLTLTEVERFPNGLDVPDSFWGATSPKHNLLIFSTSTEPFTSTAQHIGSRVLTVLDLDSGEERVIGAGYQPVWSPSGAQAIYLYWDTDTNEHGLGIYTVATNETRRLVRLEGHDKMWVEPIWVEEASVVINLGEYSNPELMVINTETGYSKPFLQDELKGITERLGLSEPPRLIAASAASNRLLFQSLGVRLLLQLHEYPYASYYGLTHIIPSMSAVAAEFDSTGDAFFADNWSGAQIFILEDDTIRTVGLPMTSAGSGSYWWTPDGAAVVMPGRQGSPAMIMNRDGSGLREIDGSGYVSFEFTKDYMLWATDEGVRLFRAVPQGN